MDRVYLKIRRRDAPEDLSYWEEFSVPYRVGMTVMAALQAIRDDAVTADGLPTSPVAFEHGCCEEMCGACSMIINGKVRMSCSTLVDDLNQPITIEPLAHFPIVRDLMVDRSSMFESLADVKAWQEIDGLHDEHLFRSRSAERQRELFTLSSCILCGCCLEACPQVNDRSPYRGAFLVSYVMLINTRDVHPSSAAYRLDMLRGPGGVAGCSNAHNCEIACPKGIPLVTHIARARWGVMKHSIGCFLGG